VNSSIKRASVINQELNIVALIDPQRWARELAID